MPARRKRKRKAPARHITRKAQQSKGKGRSRAKSKTTSSISSERDEQAGAKRVFLEPIVGWRLWLFRIIAVTIIPALLFLLLELCLRIAGYGFPTTATVKYKSNGQDAFCDNVKFTWRFFPPTIGREFDPFILPVKKAEGTYRIFVLGASAAKGTPEPAFSFTRFLQVMLQDRYPDAHFELTSVATAAINSHVVLEIAKDCARHQPDLFIVYLGNNEVVGPYGAGTVFTPLSSSLSLIRLGIALKATRTAQMVTNLLKLAGIEQDAPKLWRGMEMFLEKQVQAEDPSLKTVYQHFKRNLEDISATAKKSGAKIIFCTVASNLKDSPPFASLHRGGLTEMEQKKWDDVYQQGVEFELAGDYTQAVERYLAAAKIDSRYADLQFRLGRCYWAMGEYERARESYINARELDTLRFRADSQINEIIRDVAGGRAAEGVHLVDAVEEFEKNSPHGVPGEELFCEHVHLNFSGNYLLAKAVLSQVEQILPQWVASRKLQSASGRPVLTEEQCAQRLSYNPWTRYNIACAILNTQLKQPPFTNQLYHDERLRQFQEKLNVLKSSLTPQTLAGIAAQYRQAIDNEPTDWWLRWEYALLLSADLKDNAAAAEQYRSVVKCLPHSYRPRLSLAGALAGLGQLDEAKERFLAVLRIKPTSATAYYCLGSIHQTQGRLDNAIECYSMAVRWRPNYTEAYNNLAGVLSLRGKADQAIQVCRKGLLFAPDDALLHCNLGVLLGGQGRRHEALKELNVALQIDPNSAEIRRVLKAFQEKYNLVD
jgi:tetratricopeptide (TPR) repeat protein